MGGSEDRNNFCINHVGHWVASSGPNHHLLQIECRGGKNPYDPKWRLEERARYAMAIVSQIKILRMFWCDC